MGGRYMLKAWNAFRTSAAGPRIRRFNPGEFERQMTRQEAALILGISWKHAALEKIKEAHRKVMIANHPEEVIISPPKLMKPRICL